MFFFPGLSQPVAHDCLFAPSPELFSNITWLTLRKPRSNKLVPRATHSPLNMGSSVSGSNDLSFVLGCFSFPHNSTESASRSFLLVGAHHNQIPSGSHFKATAPEVVLHAHDDSVPFFILKMYRPVPHGPLYAR